MADGYYYLHVNGELIYKPHGDPADFRESDLVRHFWTLAVSDRVTAWRIVVEALALGADKTRVDELAAHWHCNDTDAAIYADLIGAQLIRDGDAWCARAADFESRAVSPAGFGTTALEALAELAKRLGFVASKMWGASFADLLKQRAAVPAKAGA